MKRIISILLSISMVLSLASCSSHPQLEDTSNKQPIIEPQPNESAADPSAPASPSDVKPLDNQAGDEGNGSTDTYAPPSFTSLNDPTLLQYLEDNIYSSLSDSFQSEDFIIESVKTGYVSKEYIQEVSYNSQSNVFFGYTLEELDNQFQGTRYVFTLGDDGQTTVLPFENYDDTYEQVLKDVAVGSGVILVCVTVSVVTAGAGVSTVSVVLAASAKTAATAGVSGGFIGGLSAGVIEGLRTKDFEAAKKAAALAAGEGFKWGAISGAITGAATKLRDVRHAANAIDDAANATDDVANAADDIANATDDIANNLDDVLNGVDEVPAGSVDIPDDLQAWRKAELRALNDKGGYDQLSFQNGELVPHGTAGGTRPDVIRVVNDHLEAVEVKYYDLSNPANKNVMFKELYREVTDRVTHLPEGSTQRIILDVTDRGFDPDMVYKVVDQVAELLDDIYPNIPIEVVGLL